MIEWEIFHLSLEQYLGLLILVIGLRGPWVKIGPISVNVPVKND